MSAETSFWARRRAAVQAEADADARAQIAQALREAELAEKDDSEVLAELGLPDPEAMKQGDDFAAFMAREVPERLRKKALRALWRSNPVLACVDGLNDYDDDYRIGSTGNGPLKTAYQVGKGMLYHIEEMARQAEPKADDAPLEPEMEQVAATETQEMPVLSDQSDTAGDDAVLAVEAEPEAEITPTPRRMRFRFEEVVT
jgi:hypothetical protein